MARRNPAAVRAHLPVRHRRPGWPPGAIPGLPHWVMADIRRVEATELRPGAVVAAWQRFRRHTYREAHRFRPPMLEALDCPCCSHLPDAGYTLDAAVRALPPRSRAVLRARLRPLESRIRHVTLPDRHTPPEWPWWWTRIGGIYRP
ncbi:hypothetical protein JOF53_000119 [Crossiella equi]|uniref:Uncharacterized protein n=1 Tax=Crossiella equi TaxID=130796 RepID=A0ABS5A3U5_9PSEU|nr:hypothetical protein [Crossiella equi]MBP2471247.1 hypothetical protein [Crossiella equi]